MPHRNCRRFVVVVIAALACTATWAPTASARLFRGYGTCTALEPRPTHDRVCSQGAAFGAVFKATYADLRYKLCVREPGGNRHCHRKRTHEAREPSSVWLRDDERGKYHFKWSVKGHGVVDRASLRVRSEGV
jgi:hypothetical protein